MFSDVDDIYVTECELPQFANELNFNHFEPTFPQKRPEPQNGDDADESAYERGTIEYKKARKRRQNRESAMRARIRRRV